MWHFDIPWNIFLAVGRDGVRPEDVDGLITQGKALGIYVYLIDSDHALNAAYHAVFKSTPTALSSSSRSRTRYWIPSLPPAAI